MKHKKPIQPFGWMPSDILFDPDLSAKAKYLWCYINTKPEGWDFGAERIAQQSQEGEKTIRGALKELENVGLLNRKKDPNGKMFYQLELQKTVNIAEKPTGKKGNQPKRQPAKTTGIIYIEEEDKKNIKINRNIESKDSMGASAEMAEFGNEDINQMFLEWKAQTGLPIEARQQANRRACYNLLRKYKLDGVEKLIRIVAEAQGDRYAPSISDFTELQSSLNRLLVWAKKQTVAAKSDSRIASVEDF